MTSREKKLIPGHQDLQDLSQIKSWTCFNKQNINFESPGAQNHLTISYSTLKIVISMLKQYKKQADHDRSDPADPDALEWGFSFYWRALTYVFKPEVTNANGRVKAGVGEFSGKSQICWNCDLCSIGLTFTVGLRPLRTLNVNVG